MRGYRPTPGPGCAASGSSVSGRCARLGGEHRGHEKFRALTLPQNKSIDFVYAVWNKAAECSLQWSYPSIFTLSLLGYELGGWGLHKQGWDTPLALRYI